MSVLCNLCILTPVLIEFRPPKCLSCPCYLCGQTPCLGILTVLSNLDPVGGPDRPKTVTDWLKGDSMLRPEIFQRRWRTDLDPTKHLATFYFPVKQPISKSASADDSAHAILETDLTTQFASDMQDIAALDECTKQLALKALAPVMRTFSQVVAKFKKDACIMKTSQGRGAGKSTDSIIAKKTKAKEPPPNRMYPVQGSGMSSIACAKNHAPSDSAAKRQRPGNSNHIPAENKWHCTLCNKDVKKTPDLISQHKRTKTHQDLLLKSRHCETCDVYFPNTPAAIQEHNSSFQHGHIQRLDADPSRDGPELAKKQRALNSGSDAGDGNGGGAGGACLSPRICTHFAVYTYSPLHSVSAQAGGQAGAPSECSPPSLSVHSLCCSSSCVSCTIRTWQQATASACSSWRPGGCAK